MLVCKISQLYLDLFESIQITKIEFFGVLFKLEF